MNTDLLNRADAIVAHGDNTAYISRASSKHVRDVVRDLAAALRACPSPSQISSAIKKANADLWQDIATAPKDGTPILAANSRHEHAPVVVRWDGDDKDGAEPHWCDAATRDGCALYFNPNYFDLWRPVPSWSHSPPDHAAPSGKVETTDGSAV